MFDLIHNTTTVFIVCLQASASESIPALVDQDIVNDKDIKPETPQIGPHARLNETIDEVTSHHMSEMFGITVVSMSDGETPVTPTCGMPQDLGSTEVLSKSPVETSCSLRTVDTPVTNGIQPQTGSDIMATAGNMPQSMESVVMVATTGNQPFTGSLWRKVGSDQNEPDPRQRSYERCKEQELTNCCSSQNESNERRSSHEQIGKWEPANSRPSQNSSGPVSNSSLPRDNVFRPVNESEDENDGAIDTSIDENQASPPPAYRNDRLDVSRHVDDVSTCSELTDNNALTSRRIRDDIPDSDLIDYSDDGGESLVESLELDAGVGTATRVRIFIALFHYDPATMSPNPDALDEELPFQEGQIIKASIFFSAFYLVCLVSVIMQYLF